MSCCNFKDISMEGRGPYMHLSTAVTTPMDASLCGHTRRLLQDGNGQRCGIKAVNIDNQKRKTRLQGTFLLIHKYSAVLSTLACHFSCRTATLMEGDLLLEPSGWVTHVIELLRKRALAGRVTATYTRFASSLSWQFP